MTEAAELVHGEDRQTKPRREACHSWDSGPARADFRLVVSAIRLTAFAASPRRQGRRIVRHVGG